MCNNLIFFFFQAEDGIRDATVTGVQTCALPIWDKAAIIRSGVAFAARQEPEVEEVLIRRAAEVGIPLALEGRDLHVTGDRFSLDGQLLDLGGRGWNLEDVRCRLLGVFQPGNALLAAAAARE